MRDPLHRAALLIVHTFLAVVAPMSPAWLEANSVDLLAEPAPVFEDANDWAYTVGQYFTGGEYDTAMSIISCESGFDPDADNPISTARGGWQFLKSTWESVQAQSGLVLDDYPDGPDDPAQSTAAAKWLRDAAGWTQWSCYRYGVSDWVEPVTVDLVSDGRPPRG